MKVSAITQSGQAASVNPNEGRSASADRVARAKAALAGTPIEETKTVNLDPQVERAQNSLKRIKMKTQVSPDRSERLQQIVESIAAPVEAAPEAQAPAPVVDTLDSIEPAAVTSEETKPLSPQFAALIKQKRELQLERQKFDAEKAAFTAQGSDMKSLDEYKASLKSNPLRTLLSEGVTYDQLTEAVLADSSEGNAELQALKSQIKSLEEGFDKKLSERDQQVEKQVMTEIGRDVDRLIATDDEYKVTRKAGYAPKVTELIHRLWKEKGELIDVSEAAKLIETEARKEAQMWAEVLGPPPVQKEQQQIVQQDNPNRKIMRTLTNRDGTSVPTSRRERALRAFNGG